MTSMVCVGTQWGDEGKGKIVDSLAEQARMVVRYNGGNNAGHTLNIDGEKVVLHIVPTGAMWDHTINVIGNGVFVDPKVLADEITLLQSKGKLKDKRSLIVSPFCHVIFPEHISRDSAQEKGLFRKFLGTTKRGVGPCYEDKVGRKGVRIADFLTMDLSHLPAEYEAARKTIEPWVRDPARQIAHFCKDAEERVLFEGAQGTMLDIDYGTYPFVTSSHTVASYAPVGSGVSHRLVGDVVGIAKAYVTRVGAGPFPTKLPNELDDQLRELGGEYGATTGRPRACGWLDLVALKRAVELDGITKLAITKLDVLAGMEEVKACVAYRLDGVTMKRIPYTAEEWERVEPVYESFKPFGDFPDTARTVNDLPIEAVEFLNFIEEYLECDIILVGLGPERGEEITVRSPWS